jgi:hypothetical protein
MRCVEGRCTELAASGSPEDEAKPTKMARRTIQEYGVTAAERLNGNANCSVSLPSPHTRSYRNYGKCEKTLFLNPSKLHYEEPDTLHPLSDIRMTKSRRMR